MRKAEIDHLLETAVARALGVKMPIGRNLKRAPRRAATAKHSTRHAA